jgi:hypothetical protein
MSLLEDMTPMVEPRYLAIIATACAGFAYMFFSLQSEKILYFSLKANMSDAPYSCHMSHHN